MRREDFYPASLPAEFAPPDSAAAVIASLRTRAEREAYWLRIPEIWRKAVGEHAKLFIAIDIAALHELEARRAALDEVPEIWLDDVRWHTRYLFASREVRAEFMAEQAAKREKAIARGRW